MTEPNSSPSKMCCSCGGSCGGRDRRAQPAVDEAARAAPVPHGRGGVYVSMSSAQVPLFQDAFRPFYLGAALFAMVAMAIWLSIWRNGTPEPSLPALFWHMHEMVFGFAAAVIVGFLFTAARNWTGLPLPAGASLGVLVGLWVASRVGMFVAYGTVVAALDSVLLPIVAMVLAFRFVRARSFGNLPVVAVLLGLASANIAFHVSMLWHGGDRAVQMVEGGLLLVVLLEMLIGGRIIPGFTANALAGVKQWRPRWLKILAVCAATVAVGCDMFHAPYMLSGMAALVASVLVGATAAGWNAPAVRGRPMLLVLHVSYAWIPIGFALLGLAALGVVPRTAAIHAMAVGAMGGLIIGMITRTALGHTGRPVRAGRWEVAAFALVQIAAALRVGAALMPDYLSGALFVSGYAWIAAFGLYVGAYFPVLALRRRESNMLHSSSPGAA